jgi:hypothetical protein
MDVKRLISRLDYLGTLASSVSMAILGTEAKDTYDRE